MLLGREFGWTVEEMRNLTPRELAAILGELQRQMTVEQYNEQRNHWAFLAAVITNGFSALSGAFSSKRRKRKTVEPDDFIDKKAKKMIQSLLDKEPEQKPGRKVSQKKWGKQIEDAKAKGLRGPWGEGGEPC